MTTTFKERQDMIQAMRAALAVIHAKRKENGLHVESEILAMHQQVNLQRARRGKHDVSVVDVMRQETCASGHTDYAHKFALYCADLVLDP